MFQTTILAESYSVKKGEPIQYNFLDPWPPISIDSEKLNDI